MRWGMDLTNVVVFVGESGDTDYEYLLGGVHKTAILKGLCSGSRKLHANRNYPLEHVVSLDNPNVVETDDQSCNSTDIRTALGKLGVVKE